MKIAVSVSPKYQITLVEDVRKFFPNLKPGDKVLLEHDPIQDIITVEMNKSWIDMLPKLKTKKKYTIEEEEEIMNKHLTEHYNKKYGIN